MHALLLLVLVIFSALFGCSGSRPPAPGSIEVLCAPGAELAREAGHTVAVLACKDDTCRKAADAAYETASAAAQAFCPKVPQSVEPMGPVDGGAGGGPAVHVAPPPAWGNRVVRHTWPQCQPRCEVASDAP